MASKSINPNADKLNLILLDVEEPCLYCKSAVHSLRRYSTEKTQTEKSSKISKNISYLLYTTLYDATISNNTFTIIRV